MTKAKSKAKPRRRIIPKKASVLQQWRHFAAYVYLGICIFDFFIMPIVYEVSHRGLGPVELIQASRGLDAAAQVEVIKTFSETERWQPLTLGETGLFHVAFGAILGVAAWTRGNEKRARIQRGMREAYDYEDYEDDDFNTNSDRTDIGNVRIQVGDGEQEFEAEPDVDLPPPGGKM